MGRSAAAKLLTAGKMLITGSEKLVKGIRNRYVKKTTEWKNSPRYKKAQEDIRLRKGLTY